MRHAQRNDTFLRLHGCHLSLLLLLRISSVGCDAVLSNRNLSACQMKVLTQVANYNVEGAEISEIRKFSIALYGASLQKTLLFLVTTLRISDSSYSCCNLCPCFIPHVTLFFTSDFYFIYFRKQAGLGLGIFSSGLFKIQKVPRYISRDIKFYKVEGYQNICGFTHKCCKKSHRILPKETAFNS